LRHVHFESVGGKGSKREAVARTVAAAEQRPVEQSGTGVLRVLQGVDLQLVENHVVVLIGGFVDESGQKLVPVFVVFVIGVLQLGDDAFRHVGDGLPVVVVFLFGFAGHCVSSGVRGADTPFKNWRVMVVEAVSGQTFFKKPPATSTLRISVSVVAWFQPGC